MKKTKDLNWLNLPAFLLVLGIIALHVKRNRDNSQHPEKTRTESVVITGSK